MCVYIYIYIYIHTLIIYRSESCGRRTKDRPPLPSHPGRGMVRATPARLKAGANECTCEGRAGRRRGSGLGMLERRLQQAPPLSESVAQHVAWRRTEWIKKNFIIIIVLYFCYFILFLFLFHYHGHYR